MPSDLANVPLDLRRHGRVGADRARDRADRRVGERGLEPLQVAVGLEGEAGEPEAEGGGLGVDAVRAPDAERVRVLERLVAQGVAVSASAGDDDLARVADLERERGVEDVGGGEPVVDPAPRVAADRLGDDIDERGDVVVGRALALGDGLDLERRPLPRLRRGFGRDDALGRPRLGRRQLDREPALHLPAVGPDRADLVACVALDHGATLSS